LALKYFEPLFSKIEMELGAAPVSEHPRILQKISVDLFALALWRRSQMAKYPKLQSMLAPLPSEDIQSRFAGGRGEALLPRAVYFVNYLKQITEQQFGRLDVRYLDYGCGWGRISRFLPYFTQMEKIQLVDPLAQCREFLGADFLRDQFSVINPVPDEGGVLPESDVAFLFSIFTHTPLWLTQRVIDGLSHKSGRIIIFTVRPETIWRHGASFPDGQEKPDNLLEYMEAGYSFLPQGKDTNYGDSAYSFNLVQTICKNLKLVDVRFTVLDPLQIYYAYRVP